MWTHTICSDRVEPSSVRLYRTFLQFHADILRRSLGLAFPAKLHVVKKEKTGGLRQTRLSLIHMTRVHAQTGFSAV
jgi:hypothetical protein